MASEAEVSPLKLVFLGSDPIALPLLDWLAGDGRDVAMVVAVFTQPDRPVGRGQKVVANAVKTWAIARGLPVFQPEKLAGSVRDELATLAPDVALVMAYGHILRDEFIDTPRLGTLNLHTSLLPKYRGASPIQTAVACGERETGVSLMRIIRKLDAGPVAGVERVAIGPLDTAADIEARLAAACVPLVARSLPALRTGTLQFAVQDEGQATFCRRLEKGDGALDFSRPAAELAARINGLFPWPTCAISLQGVDVKLGQADALAGAGEAGTVQASDALGLIVGTGEGLLRLRRLQRPGGRMLAGGEFLRGFSVPAGTKLVGRLMPSLLRTGSAG